MFQIFHGDSWEGTYDDPFLHVAALLSLTAGQQVSVSPVGIANMQGIDDNLAYESWFAGHLLYAL